MSNRFPLSVSAMDSPAGPSSGTAPSVKGGLSMKYNSCTAKVVKAAKKLTGSGRTEFECFETTYVDLKPSTANVTYIESCIQAKWGDEYIIVGNDGLKICDSSATRG